ncbi:helix-turn-helix transcriptional regulator [Streptomyces canus]|uniref:helix-turn-helix transcriptional regulator n=1 Tax=Streptomyces canus TaxID=58343 RepID=UPI0036AAB70D
MGKSDGDDGELGNGTTAFFGREPELRELHSALRHSRSGAARLVVIDGPAGMGKTALISRFLEQLDDVCTLLVSGEASESELPNGVVTQLVQQGRTIANCPKERAEPGGDHAELPASPMRAGNVLLELLRELQQRGCALQVLDDAHWADRASLQALTFVLRRLRFERVLTVVAMRDIADQSLPEGLRRLLAGAHTHRLSLTGLSASDLRAFGERAGTVRLTRPAAVRLHAHTLGNPLYVCSLLDELPPQRLDAVGLPLPAPRSYAQEVRAALGRCGTRARRLAAAACVLGRTCSLHLVSLLAGVEQPLEALEELVTAGLLEEHRSVGGVSVRFAHPLVRAAVYQDLGPSTRAALHLRAADLAGDGAAALEHRVLASHGPDERLATELAAYARREASVGHLTWAGVRLRQAASLVPSAVERDRLAGEAVEILVCDGRVQEAVEAADGLTGAAGSALQRCALGQTALARGRLEEAQVLLANAWETCDVATEPATAARIAEQLAAVCLLQARGKEAALWARRARQLDVPRPAGSLLRFSQMAALGICGAAEEGLALADSLADPVLTQITELDLLLGRGVLRLWTDDITAARQDLLGVLAVGQDTGGPLRAIALCALTQAEYRLGRWDQAEAHGAAATALVDESEQRWLAPIAHAVAALVPAARGQWDRAEDHLRRALGVPPPAQGAAAIAYVAGAQAHFAAARGDSQGTVDALGPLAALGDRDGVHEPGVILWADLLVDALVAIGDLPLAQAVLDRAEGLARDRGRRFAQAVAARARGNLAAARHDSDQAEAAFREALSHAAQVWAPFTMARVELDYGAFLRRTGRRTAAGERLGRARVLLAELGAGPSLLRCERELAACGRAVDQMPSATMSPLTPQELAIARLAAQGMTNRQISRELVLSVKTIECHLSHSYAKLGIGSRTELAARLLHFGAERPSPVLRLP